jgi:glyoxylase-like metal-dependent hydrolase (beta-lactamase superfamily II)
LQALDGKINYIEVIDINDHLVYFYWGRHKDHSEMNMRLGGGTQAIYRGNSAVVVDTMSLPGQGKWVKNLLQEKYGIKNFTVVNTHWHLDHITDNYLYKNGAIICLAGTRDIILENKDAIEAGTLWGPPAFPAVPPNVTFNGRLDLWLGDLKVELHEFAIHCAGHLAVYLPEDKILLAADMLEDPIWIFNFEFAAPETQLAEFERMIIMEIDRIYSSHCNIDMVKAGGYDKTFIKNNANYLKKMLADADDADFNKKTAHAYIDDALTAGELTWWEPYSEIHARNIDAILKISNPDGPIPGE